MSELKLIALDAEDLDVVSAHLQDAVVKVGDIAYLPRERRFVALLNRYDWSPAEPSGARRQRTIRRRTALRFERVVGASLQGFNPDAKSAVLALLAIEQMAGLSRAGPLPAATLVLTFSGSARIRLEVECIEAELRDLGAAWAARGRPNHVHDGETPGKS